MWDGRELKRRARAAMGFNYWNCVLVAFLINLPFRNFIPDNDRYQLLLDVSFIILDIFVFFVIDVGASGFFLDNTSAIGFPGRVFEGFNRCYWRNVAAQFMTVLYILLWGLLLIIPGIIKYYEYRMVPFLLADHPEMGWREALETSQDMMYGNKRELFLLDLSFAGWVVPAILVSFLVSDAAAYVVSAVVNTIILVPYLMATKAELYITLKNQRIAASKTDSE